MWCGAVMDSDQSADGVSCSEASDYLSFLSVFPIAQASSTGEQLGLLNFQPNLRGVSLVDPVPDKFQPSPCTSAYAFGLERPSFKWQIYCLPQMTWGNTSGCSKPWFPAL